MYSNKKILLFFLICSSVALLFFACTKTPGSATTALPNVDTIVNGNITFNEPPLVYARNNISVTVARSCPCYPSHEIYFFTANTPGITDTINTTYTWSIYMASTIVLTGKKVQYIFPIKGEWNVHLDVKTNGQLVDSMTIHVTPYGQRTANRNVSIHADCIDANRKNFISLFSTHNAPLDGHVNAIYWDFGDGTHLTDTNYLQHEYPKIAKDTTYIVKLYINNSNGCKDSAFLPVFIPATYNLNCHFTWSKTDACKPNHEVFTFIADPTGVPANATYLWDFKDYVWNVTGQTATHEFTFPNRYDVTMKIMYEGRELCHWYDTTVRAKGQFVTPIAYFYSSVEQDTLDTVRRFFNCGSKFDNGTFLTDILWVFGDGDSTHRPQDDFNARHTYRKQNIDKTYLVKMVITASSGCKDSSYTNVVIPKL